MPSCDCPVAPIMDSTDDCRPNSCAPVMLFERSKARREASMAKSRLDAFVGIVSKAGLYRVLAIASDLALSGAVLPEQNTI